MTKLFRFESNNKVPVEKLQAGDIICIAGLKNASVSDTISDPSVISPLKSTPIVNIGAKEVSSYVDLFSKNLDCLMICVTNTPIAITIAEKIFPLIKNKLLIIDLTTHDKTGTTDMKNIFHSNKIKYTVHKLLDLYQLVDRKSVV